MASRRAQPSGAAPGEDGGRARPEGGSLEALERRRAHLWAIAVVGVALLAVELLVLSGSERSLPARVALVVASAAGAAWLLRRELQLRRLTHLLVEEQVRSAALSNRLTDLDALATAGRAVNSALALEDVLEVILSSALDLLGGSHGSVMLLDGPDELCVLCVHGENPGAHDARVKVGEGVAGHVAATRQPLLVSGEADALRFAGLVRRERPVDSAVCVPLVHRDELLGVLNVNAAPGRRFGETELQAVALFAEHAAVAVANSRLFEAERAHVAQLLELDRMKSEFVATVSHELRTPLTSILGSVQTLRRPDLPAGYGDEFLTMIERQAKRLVQLVEKILSVQRAEMGAAVHPQPVELAAALVDLRRLLAAGGRSIDVRVPNGARALVDAHAFQQMLLNLVDNAFAHGRAPVEVEVEVLPGADAVAVRVLDHGEGVEPDDVPRLFERFHRGRRAGAPGIGLGLYLVRALAEAHGGRATAEPRPGGGSVFSVVLPCPSAVAPAMT